MSDIFDGKSSPLFEALAKAAGNSIPKEEVKVKKHEIKLQFADNIPSEYVKQMENGKAVPLSKSIENILNGKNEITRLAFHQDPYEKTGQLSLYYQKHQLLPFSVLKRMAIQDDCVAAIVNTRANHISAFGRRQPDPFSTGFRIQPNPGIIEKMDIEQKAQLKKDIERAERRLLTCGATTNWDSDEQYVSFSQFIKMAIKNAIVLGRIAVELVWVKTVAGAEDTFHGFRIIDAGTIYKAVPRATHADTLRAEAARMLAELKKEKLQPEFDPPEDYDWVQVLHGRPVQVFTDKECAVFNFYPVADFELNGYYPVTPLDTVWNHVLMHLNITEHNKLYFQNGRAARGMLVLQSDDVDDGVVEGIRQTFQASINGVQNSFRAPVFGVGKDDAISWQTLEGGSQDMEFQYLCDQNVRTILSAFQMSPEEIPGFAHLARGANSQSLSESSNEWKLTAARDVGLRPLLSSFQDFINDRIFPLIDPKLSKICVVKFLGLDGETPEKQSQRLEQNQGLHMTYDEILTHVEKEPMGEAAGGDYPLNPAYQAVLEKMRTKGWILEHMFGVEGAEKDPMLQYCMQDPTSCQLFLAQAQAQMQPPPQSPQGGQDPNAQPDQSGAQSPNAPQSDPSQEQQPDVNAPQSNPGGDLSSGLQQVIDTLSKTEGQLNPQHRKLLNLQDRLIKQHMEAWRKDQETALDQIVEIADKYGPGDK